MTISGTDARAGESAVIAVDVGNSKTDVAVVTGSGELLAAVHGPTVSHQQVGETAAFTRLASLVREAFERAGRDVSARPLAKIVAYSAAGADFPSDVALLSRGIRALGFAPEELVVNDCYSGLRAGSSRSWGVCVISGSGMNCIGVAPDGRVARFDSLGEMSGDWGGGGAVGQAGLAAAVRAQDGRGPATALEADVARHFGMARPRDVVHAMYRGRIPLMRHLELAPVVFAAAARGDAVARSIVNRQADETIAWATAAIRRTRLARRDPDVVLAGGIFRADDPDFYARIRAGITCVAPGATILRLDSPPVVGAALLGLDRLHGGTTPPAVEWRLRDALTHDRVAAGTA